MGKREKQLEPLGGGLRQETTGGSENMKGSDGGIHGGKNVMVGKRRRGDSANLLFLK